MTKKEAYADLPNRIYTRLVIAKLTTEQITEVADIIQTLPVNVTGSNHRVEIKEGTIYVSDSATDPEHKAAGHIGFLRSVKVTENK